MIEHREIIGRAKRAARSAKRATQRAKRMSDQIKMGFESRRLEKLDDFVTRSARNFFRVHETTKTVPAMALRLTDHAWSIGDLRDKAVSLVPEMPVTTAPDRRRRFRIIEGGKD